MTATTEFALFAKAEQILNRTLAYQAAIAVHELKDRLDLDVAELRLIIAPVAPDTPGCYRVTCIVVSLATPKALTVDVLVRPEKAIAPVESGPKSVAGSQHAKPASRGRARRSRP